MRQDLAGISKENGGGMPLVLESDVIYISSRSLWLLPRDHQGQRGKPGAPSGGHSRDRPRAGGDPHQVALEEW